MTTEQTTLPIVYTRLVGYAIHHTMAKPKHWQAVTKESCLNSHDFWRLPSHTGDT